MTKNCFISFDSKQHKFMTKNNKRIRQNYFDCVLSNDTY